MRNNVTSQSRAFSVGLVLLFFVCLRAWAQVPLPFTDDFTGSTLNPAWQVLPGQGTYSVGGGQLRYNNVGTLASTTGWYNPALTLALPFTGTAWKIEIKATYSLKWLNSGTYTGPAVPTYSGSSGGQGPEVLVKFAPGVTTSGYGGPNYAGSDVTVIERGIDAWYGGNDVPGRVMGAGRVQASLKSLRVILPVFPLVNVREAEFPILVRLIDALQESLSLFVLRKVEEYLDGPRSVPEKVALQV